MLISALTITMVNDVAISRYFDKIAMLGLTSPVSASRIISFSYRHRFDIETMIECTRATPPSEFPPATSA